MAGNLGATRLGRILHRLAWRQSPEHDEARFFYIYSVLSRRGLLAAWNTAKKFEIPTANDDHRAEWHAQRAYLLGLLRDFERADYHISEAKKLTPQRAWIWVQSASVMQMEDKHEQALDETVQALELEPWYRPAVQASAHCLMQLNRVDDSLDLLVKANERIEAGDLVAHLATLQTEMEMYEEARENWQRVEDYYPLIEYEKERSEWLQARLADAAYFCGDFDAAIQHIEQSESKFHEAILERLKDEPENGKRVMLPVGFVRQHHATCAPASLSAIAEYWSKPADHLEVAEDICYDGTPAHSERKWADDAGFIAREFRVTWDAAVSLIDAGIPFTLTTVDPGSAHLQAVIGYDYLRGTLLVRDPGERIHAEFRCKEMLEHYQSTGPRGMLLAPQEKAEVLAEIELPEAELYDQYYHLELALRKHERDAADRVLSEMRESEPNHRLTHFAARTIAAYDANPTAALEAIEALVEQFPDDVNLIISRMSGLQQQGRREELLELLEQMYQKKDADPLFFTAYARELIADAQENRRTEYLLQRAIRWRPLDSTNFGLLGDLLWSEEKHEEATELYRFAACLEEKNEENARSYFLAARHLSQTESVCEFLEERLKRFGHLSSWPARTLAGAYDLLEQTPKSFEIIEEALEQHPEDGELKLFAARFFSGYGETERSEAWLEDAKSIVGQTAWLRAAASLTWQAGELSRSLELWREVLSREPLAGDANEIVPSLIEALEGEDAALEFVCAATERFPHSYPIRAIRTEWASRQAPDVAEKAVRELLETYPKDPWARRELAIALMRQHRYDEAIEEATLAEQLDPVSPVAQTIIGRVHYQRNELESAKEAYRRSLSNSIDYDHAMDELLSACDTKQERIDALHFIADQIKEQVNYGDGLLRFSILARASFEMDELLAILLESHAARPDLWQSWTVVTRQMMEMERHDEALEFATGATVRFPLLPRIWLELARVQKERNDPEAELSALRKALEISPRWGEAERLLADLHRRSNKVELAIEALMRAIEREPRDSRNRAMVADLYWIEGRRGEAIEAITSAVEIEPGYELAWDMLREWSVEIGQLDIASNVARTLTRRRPKEARSWLLLSEMLGPDDARESLDAIDNAIEINPRSDEAHSRKAYFLSEQGRFEEALRACSPPVYSGRPPIQLRSRAAHITAMQGDMEQGIAMMEDVVRDDPDYAWAWSHLAEWYDYLGDTEKYVNAAEQLVVAAPYTATSYGYRADAHLRMGREKEAAADFRKALEYEPEYFYAARSLIDIAMQNGDGKQCRQLLKDFASSMPPGYAVAYEMRFACMKGDRVTVLKKLPAVLDYRGEDWEPYRVAFEDCERVEIDAEIAKALRSRLTDDAPTAFGFMWMDSLCRVASPLDVVQQVNELNQNSEIWASAAATMLDQYSSEDETLPLALDFIAKNGSNLHLYTRSWGSVGRAYICVDRYADVVDWLSDWKTREDAPQRILFLLAMSLRALGRREAANEVTIAALEAPEDSTRPQHLLWLAADLMFDGRYDVAHQFVESAGDVSHSEIHLALVGMMRPVVELGAGVRRIRHDTAVAMQKSALKLADGDQLFNHMYFHFRSHLEKLYGHSLRAWYYSMRAKFTKTSNPEKKLN